MLNFHPKQIRELISFTVRQNSEDSLHFVEEGNLTFLIDPQGKAPDVYVMFREDGNFNGMLDLVKELFDDPYGVIFDDLDANAFDIQIAEQHNLHWPEAFRKRDNPRLALFQYGNASYASFLYLSLNDYAS